MSVRSIGRHNASRGGILSPSVPKNQDDTEATSYETMERSATYTLVRALESEMIVKEKAGN